MNRRELFRRTLMGAAGIAAGRTPQAGAREFPADFDASKDLARPDWKPQFLDEHQNETLIIFSDLLIPTTETPGAKQALVNRFIDQLLSAETPDVQRQFAESLAFLDGECLSRYRSAFRYAPPESQVELLHLLAYPHSLSTWGTDAVREDPGYEHFRRLKDWVARAFYSSESGMRELGWDGPPHGEFEGCGPGGGAHQ